MTYLPFHKKTRYLYHKIKTIIYYISLKTCAYKTQKYLYADLCVRQLLNILGETGHTTVSMPVG